SDGILYSIRSVIRTPMGLEARLGQKEVRVPTKSGAPRGAMRALTSQWRTQESGPTGVIG
ncbi:hypothetical protein FDECE_16082, partial [Fusarium decemcellulare]